MSRQAVSRWELGQTLPSVDNLIELSRMFNVSFEEMLCLGTVPQVDPANIFAGHDRAFIVKDIVTGRLKVDLPAVLYQFSDAERMIVLKAVKQGQLEADRDALRVKLTTAEAEYMGQEVRR